MQHTFSNAGPLLLIGGAEDKVGTRAILRRFVELSGGSRASIAIIATASGYHDLVGRRYAQLFDELGAARVELLDLPGRLQSRQPEPLAQLERASGIFITGGDQLKLTAVLGGTALAEQIRKRQQAGAVLAGTSAGASAASEHMLAYGQPGLTPRQSMMHFAPGLGLLRGVVVDQHFGARGRTGRLIAALAHNPGLLGIGIDEDTAVEIDAHGMLQVLGSGAVMVIDAAHVNVNDIYQLPEGAPISIFGLTMHTLAAGARFDLHTRTPMHPERGLYQDEAEGLFGSGI